ncbi:MAG: penicillin acylase family protein, partial [Methylobacter sp.]
LTWGKMNKARFAHPFSKTVPLLELLLDMPEDELAGCSSCVRAVSPKFGASERLVVSPAHLDGGILHMPGGQSSHPLSPYYRDQQSYWVHGLPISLLAGKSEHNLTLKPGNN